MTVGGDASTIGVVGGFLVVVLLVLTREVSEMGSGGALTCVSEGGEGFREVDSRSWVTGSGGGELRRESRVNKTLL